MFYPRKGRIAAGSDADIVIWDANAKRTISKQTHHHAVDFNIFEGMVCHGVATITIVGGKIGWENGQLIAAKGTGKFIETPAFSPYVYSVIQQRDHAQVPARIPREPYTGNVVEVMKQQQANEFHSRPPTKSGARNAFDSSFALSGAQIDDPKGSRQGTGTRVSKPPGGESQGLW